VGVATAEAGIAVLGHERLHPGVLALLRSSVQRLDRHHTLEHRLGLVVRAEADVRAAGMARQRDAAHLPDLADDVLGRQADVREVEAA
jgi:hypothetical protein